MSLTKEQLAVRKHGIGGSEIAAVATAAPLARLGPIFTARIILIAGKSDVP